MLEVRAHLEHLCPVGCVIQVIVCSAQAPASMQGTVCNLPSALAIGASAILRDHFILDMQKPRQKSIDLAIAAQVLEMVMPDKPHLGLLASGFKATPFCY